MEQRFVVALCAVVFSCALASPSESELSQINAQAVTVDNTTKKAALLNWRDTKGKAVRVVGVNSSNSLFTEFFIADEAGAVWDYSIVGLVQAMYPVISKLYPTSDCTGPWYVQAPLPPRATVPTLRLDDSALEVRVVPDAPSLLHLDFASIGNGSQCNSVSGTTDAILFSPLPIVPVPQANVLVPDPFHPEFLNF
jgi:hypothetical protein